jgi:polysaccharide export outer membrane protein
MQLAGRRTGTTARTRSDSARLIEGGQNSAAQQVEPMKHATTAVSLALAALWAWQPAAATAGAVHGQQKPAPVTPAVTSPAPPQTPADYVIGVDDVLVVMFRREKDLSAEVIVRPDGKITLPLINDIQAAGLTTDQLRDRVTGQAARFVESPTVTVIVKQINSRKVFITGQVMKPGPYPIGDRMTVMQLISTAGGLTEYAKKKDIVILREPAGRPGSGPAAFKFNYDDVRKMKNLASNIELKPGDTVIVP